MRTSRGINVWRLRWIPILLLAAFICLTAFAGKAYAATESGASYGTASLSKDGKVQLTLSIDKTALQENLRGKDAFTSYVHEIVNNVFVCDGKTGTNAALLVMSSDCKNIICENNIVVIAPDMIGQQLINSADYGKCGTQENLVCRNNIFYAPAQQYTSIQLDCCKSYTFENNLYYNFPDSFFAEWTGIADEKAIRNVNPQITVAQDRTGYEKLALFKPTEQSVFSLGMALAEQNAKDILGQDAKNKTYLGAFCA